MGQSLGIICPRCSEKFLSHGSPAFRLLERVCFAHERNSIVVYTTVDQNIFGPVVRYLERKRYLVSTEISSNLIGLSPNMRSAFYIEPQGYYCWCHLHKRIDCND